MKRLSILAVAFVVGTAVSALAQSHPPPIRTTMPELHMNGGVPKGWAFLLPPGDAAAGRKVFAALNCYKCHEVAGEQWPGTDKRPGDVGPPLTGMGGHHPAEYFAESIVNPNRVIIEGPGFTGPDGSSKMPDYADSMTVRQLIDLVAYLKSLTGSMQHEMHHGGSAQPGGEMQHRQHGGPDDGHGAH